MIEINDHGSLRKVAVNMHDLARDIDSEMIDSMARSCEQLKGKIAQSAASILPKRGGLASIVSKMDMQVTKTQVSAQLTATSQYNLERLDQGEVIHPTYGHKPRVKQSIAPRFWTEPIEKAENEFTADLEKSADNAIRKHER